MIIPQIQNTQGFGHDHTSDPGSIQKHRSGLGAVDIIMGNFSGGLPPLPAACSLLFLVIISCVFSHIHGLMNR